MIGIRYIIIYMSVLIRISVKTKVYFVCSTHRSTHCDAYRPMSFYYLLLPKTNPAGNSY